MWNMWNSFFIFLISFDKMSKILAKFPKKIKFTYFLDFMAVRIFKLCPKLCKIAIFRNSKIQKSGLCKIFIFVNALTRPKISKFCGIFKSESNLKGLFFAENRKFFMSYLKVRKIKTAYVRRKITPYRRNANIGVSV